MVTQFFPPERNAPANRAGVLAAALAERGPVSVFAPSPSYPDAHAFANVDLAALDDTRPFEIHRLAPFRAHGGVVTRAWREVRLSRALARGTSSAAPDIVWATVPTMFLLPAAARHVRGTAIKCVADLRDLTWEYALDTPLIGTKVRRLLGAPLKAWMEASLRRFDAVIVTNLGAEEAVLRSGVLPERVFLLPNGIDLERLTELEQLPDPDRAPQRLHVTYCGLVGHNQGLVTLLDAAASLPGMDFSIAGGGPELERVTRMAKERGLSNLRLLGQITWPEVRELYARSDVLFAQLRRQESLDQTAVPSKVFEYMGAGRPVLYAGGGVAAALIRASMAGVVVDSEDPVRLVEALRHLDRQPDLRRSMATAGRLEASRWIREDLTRRAVGAVLASITGVETSKAQRDARGSDLAPGHAS